MMAPFSVGHKVLSRGTTYSDYDYFVIIERFIESSIVTFKYIVILTLCSPVDHTDIRTRNLYI
jgi:hypothetical protein